MQEDKSPNVRLINGSTNHEGFIQVKIDDDGWKLICARDNTFIFTLVCQELGFQGGQRIRYDVFSGKFKPNFSFCYLTNSKSDGTASLRSRLSNKAILKSHTVRRAISYSCVGKKLTIIS